ncbi:hypothetical protein MF672_010870 [Actinomadura sp. ATCC 31491]|uniref:PLAT domain-containing protein n=1 Tax=Actinomadura luzonensis TaxID=2805427 RepID=A0ABT0FPS4_9ACTN|nr:hypothetical protein [Actinomadura luzonensis]MCK2214289.1 hypothetical protein [Actinomadura luzonensis]
MSLSTRLELILRASQTSSLDLGAAAYTPQISKTLSLTSGTTAGKADRLFTDRRTLSASATENLDLAASLADAFGATITFAKVKLLYVAASASNSNNVVIGGAGSNGWITPFGDATDKLVLRPGAFVLLGTGAADATGYAVTASTGDILLVANSGAGTSVTYDIAIVGTSA